MAEVAFFKWKRFGNTQMQMRKESMNVNHSSRWQEGENEWHDLEQSGGTGPRERKNVYMVSIWTEGKEFVQPHICSTNLSPGSQALFISH